jgi:hypothetical protein
MKSTWKKTVLLLASVGLLGVFSTPSAYADNGWHRGNGRGGRVVRPHNVQRRHYYHRPYHVTRYWGPTYYVPRVYVVDDYTYYQPDPEPGWGISIESDGDIGFHAEW